MIMASEKTAMADLEDLNRTLYDIGAQDLLDVWEAMETQVSIKFQHDLLSLVFTYVVLYPGLLSSDFVFKNRNDTILCL